MLIAGLDPGLAKAGGVLIDSARNSAVVTSCFLGTSKGDDTGDMQRRLDEQLSLALPLIQRADLVVIEWFTGGFGDNARATALTAVSAAGLRGLAFALGKPTLTPAPITWRSSWAFTDDAALYAYLAERYPRTAGRYTAGKRPHVLDGLALALWGRGHATNLHHSTRSLP
jgi:hypothetical protein